MHNLLPFLKYHLFNIILIIGHLNDIMNYTKLDSLKKLS